MSQPYFPKITLPQVVLKFIKQDKLLTDFKVIFGLVASFLLLAYIAISHWQLSIGIAIAVIIGYVTFLKLILDRRKKIIESDVLFVPEAKLYVVPLGITNEVINTVRAVLVNGAVKLTESAYSFDRVATPNRVKSESPRELEIAKEISYSLKTMYQIDPKIAEFRQKIDELNQAKKLASLSEVYAEKVLDYSRIVAQIEETIENAKQLHRECFKLIGEILIGAELAKFDPDTMSEPAVWKLQFATRSNAINEQFRFLQDKEKAYSELRQ